MIRSGMLNAVREEDVCYDSDPEDFARRRSPKRKNNSAAVLHHSLLHEEEDDDDDDDDDDQCNKENRYLTSRSLLIQQQNAGIDDDFTISQMVQVCVFEFRVVVEKTTFVTTTQRFHFHHRNL